jgi:hypothetical protein
VLVGELLVFLRIVQPILEVKHNVGVAVGFIAVEAALVVIGNGVEIILLIALGLVFFRELVEVDEIPEVTRSGMPKLAGSAMSKEPLLETASSRTF